MADALNEHVYDEIRYLYDAWMEQQQEECPHLRTLETGDEVHCIECGAVLTVLADDEEEDDEEAF